MFRWARLIFVNVMAFFVALAISSQFVLPFLNIQGSTSQTITQIIAVSGIILGIHYFIEQSTGFTLRDLIPDDKSPKELEKEWRKSLKSKNPVELLENIRDFHERKMFDWVVSYSDRLLEIRPNNIEALKYGGRACNKLQRSEKAIDLGKQLIQQHRSDYNGYSIIAHAYSDLGEPHKAIHNYEIALTLAPELMRTSIHSSLVREYLKTGEIAKAINSQQVYVNEGQHTNEFDHETLERLYRIQSQFGDNLDLIVDTENMQENVG